MSTRKFFSQPLKKETLAEKMAREIKEKVLSQDLEAGEGLPTEPQLAEQFGVSRAVVRDATRILMAQGLVKVHHGKGVYVTPAENESFGDALLLTLQRNKATAWDVEEFEFYVFPEAIALACQKATEEDIAAMKIAVKEYIQFYKQRIREYWEEDFPPEVAKKVDKLAFVFQKRVFQATHNQLFVQLAGPILQLRSLRNWENGPEHIEPEQLIEIEKTYFDQIVELIEARNPEQARIKMREYMELPKEAVQAMKETPIQEIPKIPVSIAEVPSMRKFFKQNS